MSRPPHPHPHHPGCPQYHPHETVKFFLLFFRFFFHASKHCKGEYVLNECFSSLSPRRFSPSQTQPWFCSIFPPFMDCNCIFHEAHHCKIKVISYKPHVHNHFVLLQDEFYLKINLGTIDASIAFKSCIKHSLTISDQNWAIWKSNPPSPAI